MAHFYVTNSQYPENPQLFTVTITQIVKVHGEPNTDFNRDYRSEHYWELYISTSGLTSEGSPVSPIWVDVKTSEETIDDLIVEKVNELCSQIDWSQSGEYDLQQDRRAPRIIEQSPSPGQVNVPINTPIKLVLKDFLPAKGMDINTMYLKVKGVAVNPTITGNPFHYTLTYQPKVLE